MLRRKSMAMCWSCTNQKTHGLLFHDTAIGLQTTTTAFPNTDTRAWHTESSIFSAVIHHHETSKKELGATAMLVTTGTTTDSATSNTRLICKWQDSITTAKSSRWKSKWEAAKSSSTTRSILQEDSILLTWDPSLPQACIQKLGLSFHLPILRSNQQSSNQLSPARVKNHCTKSRRVSLQPFLRVKSWSDSIRWMMLEYHSDWLESLLRVKRILPTCTILSTILQR
mmetsp:Transcript_6747/g.10226  ORF Transcript_6747/g.10226 Transcript_6747/m.10226 type:complete len:226 (+) Transcript_6747:1330-2007(+)